MPGMYEMEHDCIRNVSCHFENEFYLSESFSNQICSPLDRYLAHLIGH